MLVRLFTEFVALRERYSLLHPMNFDNELTKRATLDRPRTEGFAMLRRVLFMFCAQDMAKLSLDGRPSSTSLANCTDGLADNAVRDHLRNDYAKPRQPTPAGARQHEMDVMRSSRA